ncbi:MAG: HAD family phosphatase [Oscillospiraceae bacterium]|nr:HAD family phosphatase [Oscillospiraceae bacterium]
MEYKLIASDLDGTLFGSNSRVSKENWQAIEKLKEKGVEFIPASGRAFYEMPAELRESSLIRYYITSDGAMVYDKETDTSWELPMPRQVGHAALDIIFSYPHCIMLHADKNSYMDADTHNEIFYTALNMGPMWVEQVAAVDIMTPNFREFAYGLERIQSICSFFRTKEDLHECIARLEATGELLVAQSDGFNMETFHKSAGKGNALYLLADRLGIPREATIAMGDSTNDMTMIQAAGLGLAMENAMPALREAADAVICNNNDHCVKYILEHYF